MPAIKATKTNLKKLRMGLLKCGPEEGKKIKKKISRMEKILKRKNLRNEKKKVIVPEIDEGDLQRKRLEKLRIETQKLRNDEFERIYEKFVHTIERIWVICHAEKLKRRELQFKEAWLCFKYLSCSFHAKNLKSLGLYSGFKEAMECWIDEMESDRAWRRYDTAHTNMYSELARGNPYHIGKNVGHYIRYGFL